MRKIINNIGKYGLPLLAVGALCSLVLAEGGHLPVGEEIGRWVWFDRAAWVAAVCLLLSLLLQRKRALWDFSEALMWALCLLGAWEAVKGVLQVVGWEHSNHARYLLTGSFYNPGPYSGYLALVLPICLHLYLKHEKLVAGKWLLGVMLVILAVLPAAMSRSAWVAAMFSCLWVYGCHRGWGARVKNWRKGHPKQWLAAVTGMFVTAVVAGGLLFLLKPDSALGRLFMWKITARAVAERPWSGYGYGNFASAYAEAQESYFATAEYAEWEERVAGSPEYAFNEYLQLAVEWGIPLTLLLLAVVVWSWWRGYGKQCYGICGAFLSLAVFAISSYPLQLPVFVVTLFLLLVASVCNRNWKWWLVVALLPVAVSCFRMEKDVEQERACKEWGRIKMIYQAGDYETADKSYARLYPLLAEKERFLFEYGHALHKLGKYEASNSVLQTALKYSADPMVLNIIGKNHQALGMYEEAEKYLLRAVHRLPGRIYPYYLLAKLYANPEYWQPAAFERMRQIVMTKEPKVESTAIKEMRKELEELALSGEEILLKN